MAQILQLAGGERLKGESAYETAVRNGFEGTEEEWLDSLKGADGTNGKTPEKGVDYFTEEDKTELVASVLNALPTWEGGSY